MKLLFYIVSFLYNLIFGVLIFGGDLPYNFKTTNHGTAKNK